MPACILFIYLFVCSFTYFGFRLNFDLTDQHLDMKER